MSSEATERQTPPMVRDLTKDEAGIYRVTGRCSTFGGPQDHGVTFGEGLALVERFEIPRSWRLARCFDMRIYDQMGLARQLDPNAHYCAMRWPRELKRHELQEGVVWCEFEGKQVPLQPIDFGPARWTLRVIDLSPGAAEFLGCKTDDVVKCWLVVGN